MLHFNSAYTQLSADWTGYNTFFPDRCLLNNPGALNYCDTLFVCYQSIQNLPRWAADVALMNTHQRNVKIKSPAEAFLVQLNLM